MKKILSLIVIVLLAVTVGYSQSPAPGIFNYQGVARNSVGNVLVNQNINLRLTIHDGSPGGATAYQESRAVTTNPFGLFNAQVGSAGATSVTGTVAGVNWGVGNKYIQVEIDPNGGTTFINIGTAQLASVPYSLYSSQSNDMVLPFIKTQAATGTTLIGLTNSATTGTLGAITGSSASTDANAFAITGTISSVSPGGFSAGVRGINNGTSGLGIGVYGTQAGSGWGVYGTAPSGIGVNGVSTLGIGVNGTSTSGVGVFGISSTSNAGRFDITNSANNTDALVANTNGAAASWALRATSTGLQGAGIFTLNNVTATANVVRATNNGLGRTGFFDITNAASTSNTFDAVTNGSGNAVFGSRTATTGTAAAVNGSTASTDANATATMGTITSASPGGFSAAVRGINNGTAGLGIGVVGTQAGSGWGVYGTTPSGIGVYGLSTAGFGLYGQSTSGVSVYGIQPSTGTNSAGYFQNTNTANAADALIGITNGTGNGILGQRSATTGTAAGVRGESNSQDGNANAIMGVITSTSPGGFSAAVRGANNGTGGLGIGVYGSQAGSGWGVYGTTPSGLGVYGNSASGFGVYGNSTNGLGVYGISTNGNSGYFEITNNASTSNAVEIANNNPGRSLNTVKSVALGNSIRSLLGTAPSTGIATPASIYGESSTGIGVIGVSGTQNGVYGLSSGTLGGTVGVATGTGNGLWGVNTGSTTGRAGFFETSAATNTDNSVQVNNAGIGNGISVQMTNVSNSSKGVDIMQTGVGPAVYALINNASNIVAAVRGQTNGGGYGVFGQATGNGNAGFFQISNPASTSSTVNVTTNGIGSGVTIQLTNASNGARGLDILQTGVGPGVFATSAGGNAVWGITSSISAAGVIGDNVYGEAVVGRNHGGPGVGAVVGRNDSSGYGVRGFNTKDGIGVLGQGGISGGTGVGGRFETVNQTSTANTLEVATRTGATNNLAVFMTSNFLPVPTQINVARIDVTGKGFFNGGTQVGGADVAEYFDVEGLRNAYEPGDVLVISQNSDRKVEKSSAPYSILVSGVYATKPGISLTDKNAEADQLNDMVPMGVIGVIPTKVCLEGGIIKRGDLLVTSSIPGVAMKADLDKVKVGQVLGKALQNFNAIEVGKINVLVSVK